MQKLVYAGVGSRETPELVLEWMRKIASYLGRNGWICSTGDARGADQAFRETCLKEKHPVKVWTVNSELLPEAIELALEIHPNPEAIKRSTHVTRLMARNCHQVLGADLITPVEFVVCWTKDGGPSGGTGQAIRLAEREGIRVYNLFWEQDVKALKGRFRR